MMHARNLTALSLMLLLFFTPFSQLNLNGIEDDSKEFTSGGALAFVNDVPSWQIDDKWIYETQFDVTGLLSQVSVPASVSTLTGDTSERVIDITFHELEDGTQHLVYLVKSEGDYTSGNNGATLDGTSGRLDIEYDGEDIIRVSDLATISSSFSLLVEFAPYNLGFLSLELADMTILNEYTPPLESRDFPLALGEAWYVETMQVVEGSGDSDYFDVDEIDQSSAENYSFQVSSEGTPTEDTETIKYTGCDDSFKINQWNESGVNTGFEWYCPAVRGKAWSNTYISLGLEIDRLLKEYHPANSSSVSSTSNPGTRDIRIDVDPQFPAVLPGAQEKIWGNYSWNGGPNPNTNLQARWEIGAGVWNINTDSSGNSFHDLSVGSYDDDSPSTDDMGSHGFIIWDPVQKIVGTRTIILDPDVVAIDLAARADHLIIERFRGDDSSFLSDAVGWNAVPGDLLQMSLPAQNLGILTSNETEMEVNAPDGSTIRADVPSLSAFQEARVTVNWTVPQEQAIGTVAISFEVDPDGLIIEDDNLSNNIGQFEIYIGRLAIPILTVNDPVLTFENVTLDATASIDPDGGAVRCEFRTLSVEGVEFNEWEDDCIFEFNWSDDGIMLVDVFVIDDENDRAHGIINITVINRAPYLNLSAPESILVGEKITVDATDHGDIDTITPNADVSISWPGTLCEEGTAAHVCTFTPSMEGSIIIEAIATDDDNDTTSAETLIRVLNRAPSLANLSVWNESGELTTLDGTYDVLENEILILTGEADDSLNDLNSLIFNWWLDANVDENLTQTTNGWESSITTSFQTSGIHSVMVEVWDDDGEKSEKLELEFMVENVAPSMEPLTQILPIWEDQMTWINATGSDSPSDMETWKWCWDILPEVNTDGNGSAADDCDIEGSDLEMSWNQSGLHEIVVWVMDDDGAFVSQSTIIDVRNKPPIAEITVLNQSGHESLIITIGDGLDFSATNSSDSNSDLPSLRYLWDYDGLDGNGDGDLSNDIDHEGIDYSPEFNRLGTFTVTLTVVDDDGERDIVFIEVLVEAQPEEGLLGGFLSGDGSSTNIAIGGLVLIVIALLLVVLLRRDDSEPVGPVDWNLPEAGGLLATAENMLPALDTPAPLYEAPVAMPEPEPIFAPEPTAVTSGPPIPAGGLPAGWTMEQWGHYGEQWLSQNMVASAPEPVQYQPAPTPQPTQSNVNAGLDGLLDDLDF
jgi:hypothetical protein